jgi:hypothetical protein
MGEVIRKEIKVKDRIIYEEFLKIREELDDYEDLRILRKAKQKESASPTITMKEAKKWLNL